MRPFVLLLAIGLTCVFAPAGAQAQLALTGNFDHGSLASWSGNLNNVNLVGRDNYYGNGRWRWLYFQASGVQGAQPTFSISRNFAGDATPGLHELEEHEMVYSYDQENWSFFDNNQLGATNFTFSNSAPFAQNDVYIAYAIPYSYGRSVSHTQQVLTSPWATPTSSGTASGVIGQSPARTDDLGRAIPSLDLFAYRITNPATDSASPKRRIVISSGLHAGETLGTYTYEGLVDWLISDDPRAARLRDVAEVFAYPVLNPSGRYAGMSRSTVGNPSRDPNGLWDASRWSSGSYGCNSGNCQDIRATGLAMMADVASTPGNSVDAFIDFHSTVPDYTIDPVSNIPDDFAYIDPDDTGADWWLALRLLQPNLLEYPSGGGSYTTAGFARRILNAEVELTIETQFTWERNIDYYHDLGATFGIAFYHAWAAVPGDFNVDGQVDAADYALWRDNQGATGPGNMADGNLDGTVDMADYAIWRANFGTGPPASIAASVPEPSAVIMSLIAISTGALLAARGRLRMVAV